LASRIVPEFVPKPVSDFIEALLDGVDPGLLKGTDPIDSGHYEDAGVLPTISHLEGVIGRLERIRLRDKKQGFELRDAKHDLKVLVEKRDFLFRLISDERMREAYKILGEHILIEPQLVVVIRSAIDMRNDYAIDRREVKRLKEINLDLRKQLAKTIKLLEKFIETDPARYFGGPEPYYYLNNYWHSNERETSSKKDPSVSFNDAKREHYSETLNKTLDELLDNSRPRSINVLRAMLDSSQEFQPSMQMELAAALSSRKHNPKYDFIRAFSVECFTHPIAPQLPNKFEKYTLIAAIASVALDAADDPVSAVDVRIAFEGIDWDSLPPRNFHWR